MAGEPLISLIIPVYNGKPYLEETLQSVLDQTLPRSEIEVIAVDDASTDGSMSLLKTFCSIHGNAQVAVLPSCSGAGGAPRNLGISLARGRYIQFIDADDLLLPEACERLGTAIERLGSDMLSARYESFSNDSKGSLMEPEIFDLALPEPLENVRAEEYPEFFAPPPAVWSRIFQRSFLISRFIRFPEGLIGQDSVFVAQALLEAERISTIPDIVCHYRIRNAEETPSASSRLDYRYFHDCVRTRLMVRELFSESTKLDYYPVLYGQHINYLLDRAIDVFTRGLPDLPRILEELYPLFSDFRKLDLKYDLN